MSNLTLESLAHLATYLSAIVAALFALSSIRSSRDSKLEAGRANENADKANVLANDANAYATDANRYAQQANDYAKKANVLGAKSWADQIGYASYDFTVMGADDSEGKKGKAKNLSDKRHIQFQGHAGLDVGCRAGYEMPSKVDLSWDAYRAELNKLFTKKKEA